MHAVVVQPGIAKLQLISDYPEPQIQAEDDVKVQVLQVGICGTDREEAAGGRAKAPLGQQQLVIGHEMLGRVVEVGKAVTRVRPGDAAVFTVRRGCGQCLPCLMNRSDMCETGLFTERGIWGRDGYQTEYVVDKEQYIVRVPPELSQVGVLTEPLSVVEKAIDEMVRVQAARLPDALATPNWLEGRRCLVAGLGPIGLLASLVLRLRGAEVWGMDIVDPATNRPQWLIAIGGQYVDGRQVPPEQVEKVVPTVEFIIEATGIPALEFNLLDVLGYNGAYVLTGIPGGDRPLSLPGAELIRSMVLKNLLMSGSVNAARGHFMMAVDDLRQAWERWGDHLVRLITGRYPFTELAAAIDHHAPDEIKTVIEWKAAG